MPSHPMSRLRLPGLVTTAALVAGGIGACADGQPAALGPATAPDAPAYSMGMAEMNAGLATLRRVTARYHRVAAAEEDGFSQFLPQCVEGLGLVYANPDRVDAILDLAEPEVLFYEPQKNGRLRLIGVETVVPIAAWTGSDRPSLFGHEFHRNEGLGLFGIHIWVWRHHPEGMFAFMHPEASCEFAG